MVRGVPLGSNLVRGSPSGGSPGRRRRPEARAGGSQSRHGGPPELRSRQGGPRTPEDAMTVHLTTAKLTVSLPADDRDTLQLLQVVSIYLRHRSPPDHVQVSRRELLVSLQDAFCWFALAHHNLSLFALACGHVQRSWRMHGENEQSGRTTNPRCRSGTRLNPWGHALTAARICCFRSAKSAMNTAEHSPWLGIQVI